MQPVMSREPSSSKPDPVRSPFDVAEPERVAPSRWIGLVLGPLLGVVVYLALPDDVPGGPETFDLGLDAAGRAVAAVGTLMAVWWVTEALPIAATALLPIALLPLVTGGLITVQEAAAPYAHPLIFLFLGGFLIALAMQRWGLHRRIAIRTILLVGTEPRVLVGGFMLAAAFLSMWVSNTATVVMMLPIALSVIELVRRELIRRGDPHAPSEGRPFPFAMCLLLGTAYAASIGGIGTLIGTPPNALLAAFIERNYNTDVSFAGWMAIGLPLVVVFLPIAWLLLTRVIYRIRIAGIPGGRGLILDELRKLGPMARGEWLVLIVFVLTATAWMTRPLLNAWSLAGVRPLAGLTDAGIAIGASVVLFATPVHPQRGQFLLSWQQARQLPWSILILFGGGLSLASAVRHAGVAAFIGQSAGSLHHLPVPLLVLLITAAVVFLTELTSNTATTATLLPVLAAVAGGLGVEPALLLVPTAIAASCAFMMPVATPPNAVVFSSGELTIPQMCKAGLWLNLIGIGLIMALAYTIIIRVTVTG